MRKSWAAFATTLAGRAYSIVCAFVVFIGSATMAVAHPATVEDVVASSTASGTAFRLITSKGSVSFTVPNDWAVISMQSRPPVSVAGFQAPNPADEGSPDSTNAAVTLFHLESAEALAARKNVGEAYGPATPITSQYNGWTVYTQEPTQGGTIYTLVDGVRDFSDANAAVAVRLAWPHLKGNRAEYDVDMIATYHRLLDSVSSTAGSYSPSPTEVVRRPTN